MRKKILIVSGAVYILIYILTIPKIYTIFDESCYLDLAYALRTGTIYLDETDIGVAHYPIKNNGHLVSKYPPGNSLLLLPFTFLGKNGIFLYGLIFHIIGYVVFAFLLRSLGIEPKYAIFYLFYPSYVLFSRTLMSDIPATCLFLAGFYCYTKEKYTHSGALFGFSFLVRYINIVLFLVFFIMTLFRKKIISVKMFLGFLPFLFISLLYNKSAYGGFLKAGYLSEGVLFNPGNIFLNLSVFLIPLLIVYPFLVVSPFVYKGKFRLEILLSCGFLFCAYSLCSTSFTLYDLPEWENFLKVSLLATRYFFPAISLMLISYSSIAQKHIRKFTFWCIMIILVVMTIGIHLFHTKYLNLQVKFRDTLYEHTNENSLIVCNGEATELISKIWGQRKVLLLENWNRDSSIVRHSDVYLAVLSKYDRPGSVTHMNSFLQEFQTIKLEEMEGLNNKFELYKVTGYVDKHNTPSFK